MPNDEFLIEGILPKNEVHLLGGSSGSGKTTFLFQTIADWQEGREVMGHTSYPAPYAYISIDRSRTSVARTLKRLDLADKITRVVCREDLPALVTLPVAITYAREAYPDATVFFIEGFQTLVGDKGNSYTPVAQFLASATALCAANRFTIVGICHSPKLKTDEGFQHPREMLLGSAAWAAYSDTVIIMDLSEKTGIITVSVLPRNAAKEVRHLAFSPPDGKLIEVGEADKRLLITIITTLATGTEFTKKDAVGWGTGLGLSERTVERVLTELVEEGEIIRSIQPGAYKRAAPVSN